MLTVNKISQLVDGLEYALGHLNTKGPYRYWKENMEDLIRNIRGDIATIKTDKIPTQEDIDEYRSAIKHFRECIDELRYEFDEEW